MVLAVLAFYLVVFGVAPKACCVLVFFGDYCTICLFVLGVRILEGDSSCGGQWSDVFAVLPD